MIKKSFIGMAKPQLLCEALESVLPEPEKISISARATFLLKMPHGQSVGKSSFSFEEGDKVITGQKLALAAKSNEYIVSSVTGKISSIKPFEGNFGQMYTAISIETAQKEEKDKGFKQTVKNVTLENINKYLLNSPGCSSLGILSDSAKPINTIIISGMDKDLLVTTNQYILKSDINAVKKGIKILKEISGVGKILVAVPPHLMDEASVLNVRVKTVGLDYPAAFPELFMKNVLGTVLPAEKSCEDAGVCFLSCESVACLGNAFEKGEIPVEKTFTFIKKDGSNVLVSAKIGTPLVDIFRELGVSLRDKDRIIIGGPMTGFAVYSEDYPVMPDTDAVMVQDSADVSYASDYPCINCGECIRICPADVPVNMLVRLLEAELYDEAAEQYDLHSCIECGLCSYVCTARIPIFQYIRLAKHELACTRSGENHSAEEKNAK